MELNYFGSLYTAKVRETSFLFNIRRWKDFFCCCCVLFSLVADAFCTCVGRGQAALPGLIERNKGGNIVFVRSEGRTRAVVFSTHVF